MLRSQRGSHNLPQGLARSIITLVCFGLKTLMAPDTDRDSILASPGIEWSADKELGNTMAHGRIAHRAECDRSNMG